jgi:hypothetical protein
MRRALGKFGKRFNLVPPLLLPHLLVLPFNGLYTFLLIDLLEDFSGNFPALAKFLQNKFLVALGIPKPMFLAKLFRLVLLVLLLDNVLYL